MLENVQDCTDRAGAGRSWGRTVSEDQIVVLFFLVSNVPFRVLGVRWQSGGGHNYTDAVSIFKDEVLCYEGY